MNDIKDLIARLREESLYKDKATLEIMDLCMAAAEALENLDAQLDVLVKEDIEAQQELAGYRDLGTLEHLRELAQAERDGRMVVLDASRKPLLWGDKDHETCLCPYCREDLMGISYGERMLLQCPVCGQYLDATKVNGPEETEAAQGCVTIEKEDAMMHCSMCDRVVNPHIRQLLPQLRRENEWSEER